MPRLLVTADGTLRRGAKVDLKRTADDAVAQAPSVEHMLVVGRISTQPPQAGWVEGRDRWWSVEMADPTLDPLTETPETDPETPYMIIYTSGTTGRPKGAVHVHGGFPIKGAQDLAHCFDLGRGDKLFWFTDLGWMMGPWAISGALLLGAELVLYEGAPDFPAPDRLWALIARHGVTHLGLSPTVIRALMAHGTDPLAGHDLTQPARARFDRRAVEPGIVVVVLQQRRRRPTAAHQLQRRHGGQRRHRQLQPAHAHQADVVSAAPTWAPRPMSSTVTATPSVAWSASWPFASRCRA